MTKQIEALNLALEALETLMIERGSIYDKAITAIKEALAQPEQEPVVCDCDSPSWCKQYKKCNRKMLGFMPYVAQPQRTWVGLTDDEILSISADCASSHQHMDIQFARAIEAAHGIKEKNT